MSSPFADILETAMAATPGAIGGAFAAWDGEAVEYISTWDDTEWLILTAHYGVVLSHIQSALHTFHFGEAETVCVTHASLDIVVRAVKEGYFALLAVETPSNLGKAMRALDRAALLLREEMG